MSASDKPKLDPFFLDGMACQIDTMVHALGVIYDLVSDIETRDPDSACQQVCRATAVVECAIEYAKKIRAAANGAVIPFRDAVRGGEA